MSCFFVYYDTPPHWWTCFNVLAVWGQLHIVEREQELNSHRAYLYVYSINSLSLFGCLGNEDASGLRSPSSIHQAWDRDGGGSAAGQRLSSYSPSHTHIYTHTHPGGTQHSMPPCIKVCVCVDVSVCLCADMPNEHLLVSLAQTQYGGRDANKRQRWELNTQCSNTSSSFTST